MISIRAPTKGATYEKIVKSFITKISIHAPTKGATPEQIQTAVDAYLFQSTLPRRERLSI